MHKSLKTLDHRPWPLPRQAWRWRQSWVDLLFAHWRVPVDQLKPMIPEALNIQEFDGSAWLGVVPFRMSGVMHRGLPDVPGFSAFPEWNVRTYVSYEDKPGVWFLSLDATQSLAVWGGRRCFHLPYYRAGIEVRTQSGSFAHKGCRKMGRYRPRYAAEYRPISAEFAAKAGSLEHWLTERYCLYAQNTNGHLSRTEVHHRPWPLQQAEANLDASELVQCCGFNIKSSPDHLLFSSGVDVVAWNPVRL